MEEPIECLPVFIRFGIKFHFVDMNDIEIQVINQREYKTGLVQKLLQSMKLADIQEIAAITKRKNSFCSRQYFCNAYLQKPLDLGADIVMHSATKYLGH
jgi:cystathionine beta-lyase/cystathionine gamma-synthase